MGVFAVGVCLEPGLEVVGVLYDSDCAGLGFAVLDVDLGSVLVELYVADPELEGLSYP